MQFKTGMQKRAIAAGRKGEKAWEHGVKDLGLSKKTKPTRNGGEGKMDSKWRGWGHSTKHGNGWGDK